MSAQAGRAGVFLDRDGTLIRDRHYLGDPAGVELVPGAAGAVAQLNHAGVPVLLVTNQSGIGRGYFTEADFQAVQRRLQQLLAEHGASLDGVYHCPHAPDRQPRCDCRKPATGLFRRAAEEHGLDLQRCFFVGDRARDVLPAGELGGTGILVRSDSDAPDARHEGEIVPADTHIVATLAEAAALVLRCLRR